MRSFLVSATLLLTGATLSAQGTQSRTAALLLGAHPSQDCPVSLTAQQRGGSQMLQAGEPQSGSGQGVHLDMSPATGKRIVDASVTVHALSAKGRYLPTAFGAAPDVSKEFELVNTGGGASLGSDLWMHHVAAVVWVDVTSIRYADRTLWHAKSGSACHVEPDGVVYVAQN